MTEDTMDEIVTILNNGWNVSTGGSKPTIELVEHFKRVDLGGNQDVILVYGGIADITPQGLGYGAEQDFQPISIDIRTTTSKARVVEMLTEVKLIIHTNRRKAVNGLHDLIIYAKETPLSNRTIKLWRYIVGIEVKDFARPVP